MAHTDDEIAEAARRFERLADDLDPAAATAESIDDLGQIAEAVRADEVRLRQSVSTARAHDRSWNEIALALGVSRQAARQRYSSKVDA